MELAVCMLGIFIPAGISCVFLLSDNAKPKKQKQIARIVLAISIILIFISGFSLTNTIFDNSKAPIEWADAEFGKMIGKAIGKLPYDIYEKDIKHIEYLYIFGGEYSFAEKINYEVNIHRSDGLIINGEDYGSFASGNIKDISDIKHFQNLMELAIDSNKIEDISPLAGCKKLRFMDITRNEISSLEPLRTDFNNLENLQLVGNKITDISSISNLTNLTTLRLSYNSISNCEPIINLEKLTKLSLSYNKIVDMPDLSNLSELKELYLYDNAISELSFLPTENKITILSLGYNKLYAISQLTDFVNLERLDLDYNALTTLPDLSKLINLQHLDISYNNIIDITPVSTLKSLNRLNISRNAITDVSCLQEKAENYSITSHGNPIENWEPLTLAKSLDCDAPDARITITPDNEQNPAFLTVNIITPFIFSIGDYVWGEENWMVPDIEEMEDSKFTQFTDATIIIEVPKTQPTPSLLVTAQDFRGYKSKIEWHADHS